MPDDIPVGQDVDRHHDDYHIKVHSHQHLFALCGAYAIKSEQMIEVFSLV
jgi:hypothetical protein